jgi:chemotaxis protein MotB
MRRHRRDDDEHENVERWLVSYADFITLLFAFFVVMYAISQVNEGKYRILSDALTSAFHRVPGTTSSASAEVNSFSAIPMQIPLRQQINFRNDELRRQARERMRNAAGEVRQALAPLVQQGLVRVFEGAQGVTIEINASVLFESGEARLGPEAQRIIGNVAKILAPTGFPLKVEGHTDSQPIATPQFPSNWELSGARASSVVRLFIDSGVEPRRLTAVGYADQRPVADNADAEGRARNRRVAITMESQVPDAAADMTPPPPASLAH